MLSLKGKLVLVTGASSGIGRACTLKLAESGAEVLAVARRKDRLLEIAKASNLIRPIEQDMLKPLTSLKAALNNRAVDILVNNAGLALGRDSIQDVSPEDWNIMIDTNIKALIAATQLVLPKMIERKTGDIVNLGSIAAYYSYAGGSIYNATKFAVRALTDAWRQDLNGKGIRFIGIHPGMVETEFSLVRAHGDAEKAKSIYAGMTPLTANDIADTILWTLSRPRHINIQSVVIMPTDQASIQMVHRGQTPKEPHLELK